MPVPRQPFFPITLEEVRTNPAMIEHWPFVARLLEGYMLTCMYRTALQHEAGVKAGDEAAAMKALARLIQELEPLSQPDIAPKKEALMRPLKRFSGARDASQSETKNPTSQ